MTEITDQILFKLVALAEGQAEMKAQMVAIQATVHDNTKLLRGNGVPGLTTEIALLKEEVAEINQRTPSEALCRKDVLALKERIEEYPTYLWLLRNRWKSTVSITAGLLFFGFVIISPLVDHTMFGALLTWVGVPAAVIKQLLGG